MHEMSLTEKMLRLVLDQAAQHQAQRITKIKLVIGDLSGIIPECVEGYFRLIAAETRAADAELEFVRAAAQLFCVSCNREFTKSPGDFLCPTCGNLARLTENGRECFVESIEVE